MITSALSLKDVSAVGGILAAIVLVVLVVRYELSSHWDDKGKWHIATTDEHNRLAALAYVVLTPLAVVLLGYGFLGR